MASLRKDPRGRSKFWYCCYRDAQGNRTTFSTKCTGRRQALKICQAREEAAFEAKHGKLSVDRALELAKSAVAGIMMAQGDSMPSATIKAWCERWLEAKEVESEEGTVARYRTILERFVESLGPRAERDLATLRSSDVAAFRDERAKSLSVASANLALKVLRVCLGAAVRQGFLSTNPATVVPVLKRKGESKRRPFTVAEIKKLLVAAADTEWRGLILCGLYTGQRLGDVARLRWGAVDLPKRTVAFVTQKTGRRLTLPLAKALATHLEGLPSSDDPGAWVFPKSAAVAEKRVSALSNGFHDLMASAGLVTARSRDLSTSKVERGRRGQREVSELSFHALRHTATTLLKAGGVTDVLAREIIGHESEAVSREYTHIETEHLREAIDGMPDVTANDEEKPRKPTVPDESN